MKNRHGDHYHFREITPNHYTIEGELRYWRWGGRTGQDTVDTNNLGFVDPSGGPYIGIGYDLNGKTVTRIWVEDGRIMFQTQ